MLNFEIYFTSTYLIFIRFIAELNNWQIGYKSDMLNFDRFWLKSEFMPNFILIWCWLAIFWFALFQLVDTRDRNKGMQLISSKFLKQISMLSLGSVLKKISLGTLGTTKICPILHSNMPENMPEIWMCSNVLNNRIWNWHTHTSNK